MTGLKRNQESNALRLLDLFPVLLILGVRQCGKTTLARKIRPDWQYFDLEKGTDFDFITRDFDFFFKEHPRQIIIDEAQRSPQLFSELRGIVDGDRQNKNRFILTGSSSPELLHWVSETLAGRIGIIELGTFKMNEVYSKPLSPFYQIFNKKITDKTSLFLKQQLQIDFKHDQVMHAFLRGGYPEPILAKDNDFHEIWMNHYFKTYIDRDIRSLFPRLDLLKYRRFITMLSSLTGTAINKSQLGRSLDTSEVTIRDYLEVVHGSFVWRNLPSFETSASKSVVKMPKGSLRDSGLCHYLQRIKTREALISWPHVGASFESFVIEEIIKGLEASLLTQLDYHYYRTKNGAEVDLILRGDFGLLPVEIKFGSNTRLKQFVSLQKFIDDHHLPLGLVINNSDRIAMISDKIIQIPAGAI